MALPQWIVDQVESPEPSPLDQLIAAESKSDQWVRVFLTGCNPWPAPRDSRGRCGICHDLPLPPGWYCGGCDRPKGSGARLVRVKAVDKAACGLTKAMTRREKRKGRKAA